MSYFNLSKVTYYYYPIVHNKHLPVIACIQRRMQNMVWWRSCKEEVAIWRVYACARVWRGLKTVVFKVVCYFERWRTYET